MIHHDNEYIEHRSSSTPTKGPPFATTFPSSTSTAAESSATALCYLTTTHHDNEHIAYVSSTSSSTDVCSTVTSFGNQLEASPGSPVRPLGGAPFVVTHCQHTIKYNPRNFKVGPRWADIRSRSVAMLFAMIAQDAHDDLQNCLERVLEAVERDIPNECALMLWLDHMGHIANAIVRG